MAQLAFNSQDHEPSKPMGPVPEGTYLVAIRESEVKPTKAGNGQLLALIFDILEGEHQGRKIYDNININNPSPKAMEIGLGNLSAICHAVNVLQLQDSIQLHDLPLMVDVKCEGYSKPGTGERVIKNTITGYKSKLHTEPVHDQHQGQVQGVPPQYAQPAMAAGQTAPWGAQA